MVAGLSPKAIIFFGTIFSSFINYESNIISQFINFNDTYVVLDFATLMIYGLLQKKFLYG